MGMADSSHKAVQAPIRYAMSSLEGLRKSDLSPEEHEKIVGNTRVRIPFSLQGAKDLCSPA